MKKSVVALLLIALIAGKDIQEFGVKSERDENIRKNDITLKEPITISTLGFVVKAAITITVARILDIVYDKIYYRLTHSNIVDTFNEDGKGHWYSDLGDDYVLSAYYHETKKHSATCDGGFLGGGQERKEADAGKWAFAVCHAGISGRKTYWNVLE